jgi:hypothetical protein
MNIKHLIAIIMIAIVLGIAQAGEPLPLDCLQDATGMVSYPGGAIDWQSWLGLEGVSVWVGYENGGWDVPADITGIDERTGELRRNDYTIYGWQHGEHVQVWIRYSETTGDYYLFPFADTSTEDGAMHPCGGWRVDGEAFEVVIDGS